MYCFECVCVILCFLMYCIVLCIIVPLPPRTYPLAINNNNNNNNKGFKHFSVSDYNMKYISVRPKISCNIN
jgi:hypothetical protein